ncbi:efflux RND transporter periplasmic adaptor subunit [Shewanella olleyana]|uniref:efflux RND transporter periplasmic adaptor subunit n=1 Tax=Shewanella olleyana TaxID=135626 RepID=UPI00200BF424|nr:efflux RND transporter periplasmic adaptor subunit [Shewanella olleyana]MCL1068652.1 efflux RND transporter periplasmic adaptor subunit [Shewanella olleyana]
MLDKFMCFSRVLIFALVAISFTGITSSMVFTADNASVKSMPNELLTIKLQQHTPYLQFDGQIEAIKAATVSAQTAGRILKLNYDVNDTVPAGAALLEITSKEQGAGLAAAEAELAQAQARNVEAQAQFKRYQELFPKGAISKGAMDEATANSASSLQAVSAANAKLIQAKETLNYTTVNAPFSGRVTERFVEQGETVTVGQALYAGYSTDNMRAIFQLPQQYRTLIDTNSAIDIEFASGMRINSTDINPYVFLQNTSQSFQVRINLPQTDIAISPGEWVKVLIADTAVNQIIIPSSAVFQRGDYTAVFRQHENKLVQTQVRLRQIDNEHFVVEAGLMEGDEIIVHAADYLLNSPKVGG